MTINCKIIPPLKFISGSIVPPGSKSIANRALSLAALGKGSIQIKNLPDGEDVRIMINALKKLNLIKSDDNSNVIIRGTEGNIHMEKPISLPMGNSGTSIRFLTAALSTGKGDFFLDGIPRMKERPIGDLVQGITQLAKGQENTVIEYPENQGYPPLKIKARGLSGGKSKIKGDLSSQFLSALLMALPYCKNSVEIEINGKLVSSSYISLTLKMLEQWGCEILNNNFKRFFLDSPQGFVNPTSYFIEADASSASYFLAAGAIAGGPITVKGVGSDSLQYVSEGGFIHVLEKMGAHVIVKSDSMTVSSSGGLIGGTFNMDKMSDTGMTLAITALYAKGTTLITNIGNWRLKETDRLSAMTSELTKLGAKVIQGEDYLEIHPPEKIQSAEINTYNDHRMAMCFSLAAFGNGTISIQNPECVAKTYPNYFEDFLSLTDYVEN